MEYPLLCVIVLYKFAIKHQPHYLISLTEDTILNILFVLH